MAKKGKKNGFRKMEWMLGLILVVVLVAVTIIGASMMSLGEDIIEETDDYVTGLCDTDGINSVNAASKNTLNRSLEYQAGALRLIPTGSDTQYSTGTGTAGASLTYTALNAPCTPRTGNVYALGTADLVSGMTTYKIETGVVSDEIILSQPDSSQAQTQLFDKNRDNTSDTFAATQTETTAVAMSDGDSRSGSFDIKAPTSSSQYGGPIEGKGLVFVIDTVDANAFSEDSISLSSTQITLTEIDCDGGEDTEIDLQRLISKDSADRCYIASAIKATDGEITVNWVMNNDAGDDAGASSDPILYVEDLQYFEDTDGSIVYGAFTAGGTNVGESQVKLTWANS